MVRGRGYIQSDGSRTWSTNRRLRIGDDGVPVYRASDVADRQRSGPDMRRRGLAELDGRGRDRGRRHRRDALRRETRSTVIDRVKGTPRRGRASTLPAGVSRWSYHLRSLRVDRARSIDTLNVALSIEEMIVVSVVIMVSFLLHVRSSVALVPILTLPLAVLLAFIPMYAQQGLTDQHHVAGRYRRGDRRDGRCRPSSCSTTSTSDSKRRWEAGRAESNGPRRRCTEVAMQEVGPSIFFSLLVITVSFMPVFTLEGGRGAPLQAARLHQDLLDGVFAALLAITLTPALAAIFDARPHPARAKRTPLNRWTHGAVLLHRRAQCRSASARPHCSARPYCPA